MALVIDRVTLAVPLGYPDDRQQMFACLRLRVSGGVKPGEKVR